MLFKKLSFFIKNVENVAAKTSLKDETSFCRSDRIEAILKEMSKGIFFKWEMHFHEYFVITSI